MVFERDIPSCSPCEVLIRYLRRILQQVQNGIDSDCISFRLENLIDLLLRSAHLYQDGGQVLAVLRAALTAVENCRQSEDDPTIWGNLSRDSLFANCLFSDAFLRVVFMPLCVLPFCVLPLCVLPFCVMLFACCLFALCLFACCLWAWYPFFRDTYMVVAFLVFLPFTVVFFYQLWLGIFQVWLNPFHF